MDDGGERGGEGGEGEAAGVDVVGLMGVMWMTRLNMSAGLTCSAEVTVSPRRQVRPALNYFSPYGVGGCSAHQSMYSYGA